MPLHRDIHWLGRQWAVTGHGIQLINQKQMGYYDVEIARLWGPRTIATMQSKAWINREDFDRALAIARARFADQAPRNLPPSAAVAAPVMPADFVQPALKRAPIEPSVVPAIEELLARLKSNSARPAPPPDAEPSKPAPSPMAAAPCGAADPVPSAPRKPFWAVFDHKVAGSARFVHPWRVASARWHGPGLPPRP